MCPTEIIAFSDRASEFEAIDTALVGASVDSHFSHLAWVNTPRKQGGLGGLNYPLLSDLSKKISADYDVLLPAGISLRYHPLLTRVRCNGIFIAIAYLFQYSEGIAAISTLIAAMREERIEIDTLIARDSSTCIALGVC